MWDKIVNSSKSSNFEFSNSASRSQVETLHQCHRTSLFQVVWSSGWVSWQPWCWIVYWWEQFYRNGNLKGRVSHSSSRCSHRSQDSATLDISLEAWTNCIGRANCIREGYKIIFTDSKYGFHLLQVHVAIWKERGMLTARNFSIKHKYLILAF